MKELCRTREKISKFTRILMYSYNANLTHLQWPLYRMLVYTRTVDSVDGARRLARQTPNILCYLPPSNSRENGVPVWIRDK